MNAFTGTDLVRRASLDELLGHRARALELYQLALATLAEAARTQQKCSPSPFCHMPHDLSVGMRVSEKEIQKALDRGVWLYLLEQSGMRQIMDHRALEDFRNRVEKDPPPATMENLVATFQEMHGNRREIFERGVVEAFAGLSRYYRSNDGFKIGNRVVITYGFHTYSYSGKRDLGSTNYRAMDQVRDLDRVLHLVDGKAPPDHLGDAAQIIRDVSSKQHGKPGEAKCAYFRAKWYLNGNLHLFIDRDDLLASLNEIVARHKGETLPDGRTRT